MKRSSYRKLFSRSFLTWLLFIPVVVLNGALREAVYKPFTGELAAHQISTVLASVAFVTLAYFRLKNHLLPVPNGILYRIGLMWVGLTVLFETCLGLFIVGDTWDKLLHDYNIFAGRIWSLFLLVVLFTPAILKQFLSTRKANKLQYSK